jgi:hypothetical protein
VEFLINFVIGYWLLVIGLGKKCKLFASVIKKFKIFFSKINNMALISQQNDLERIFFWDYLRTFVVVIVVLHHSALAYLAFVPFSLYSLFKRGSSNFIKTRFDRLIIPFILGLFSLSNN